MSGVTTGLPVFLIPDSNMGSVGCKVLQFAGLPKFIPGLTKTPGAGGTTTAT